ncbi:MAG: DUF4238 domain-containing protein [Rubripirellula sp.]
MVNQPIRQHTVPKVYLKRFPLVEDRLFEFRPEEARWFGVSAANASVRKHAYTYNEQDGTRSYVVEESLSKLESMADAALKRLDELGPSGLQGQERLIIANFIAVQHYRTNKMKEVADTAESMLRTATVQERLLDESLPEIIDDYSEAEIAEYRQSIRDGTAKFGEGQFFVRHFMGNVSKPVRDYVFNMDWRTERIVASSHGYFITSDTPFAVRRRGKLIDDRIVPLRETDSEFYFPVSNRTMLIGSNDGGRDRKLKSQLRIDELNKIILANCHQSIYSPLEDERLAMLHATLDGFKIPAPVPFIEK